jgi:hypothetical protein
VQFGIFMFCTIGFSLVFALGLYATAMGMIGPEGERCDIRVPFRACVKRLSRWRRRRRGREAAEVLGSEGGRGGCGFGPLAGDDVPLLHAYDDVHEPDDALMGLRVTSQADDDDDDEPMLVLY